MPAKKTGAKKTKAPKKKEIKKEASVKKDLPASKKVKKSTQVIKTNGEQGIPEEKQQIIAEFAQGKGDTGSPEVQVALLTHKIARLTGHLEENKKDNHSRRGLLKVIAKRRRILNYLQDLDKKRYAGLIDRLGLKK